MQWRASLTHSVLAMSLLTGCVKGTTEFTTLDSNSIPQPRFDGATVKEVRVTSSDQEVDLTGQCDYKISKILVQTPSMTVADDLNAIAVGNSALNCKTSGTFTLKLKSWSNLGFPVVENTPYEIEMRGLTSAGLSKVTILRVTYSNPNGDGPKGMLLTSGATESGSTGQRLATSSNNTYRGTIRVDHRQNYDATPNSNVQVKTSANYKAVIGTAARQY